MNIQATLMNCSDTYRRSKYGNSWSGHAANCVRSLILSQGMEAVIAAQTALIKEGRIMTFAIDAVTSSEAFIIMDAHSYFFGDQLMVVVK